MDAPSEFAKQSKKVRSRQGLSGRGRPLPQERPRQRSLSPAGLLSLDNIRPAEEGRLADLTFVRKKEAGARTCRRLPYIGPCWYGKPATAFILDTRLATWVEGPWTPPPTSRRTASPDTGDHGDGLAPRARSTWPSSLNALIGLWARSKKTKKRKETRGATYFVAEQGSTSLQNSLFEHNAKSRSGSKRRNGSTSLQKQPLRFSSTLFS